MIEQATVREMITGGESAAVEFKRDDIRPEQLAREVVAMANQQGGTILLGVEDDGTISGIKRDNLQEWIFDTALGRYVYPALELEYGVVEIDGSRVAVLSVDSGRSKPYVLRNNDREEIYVRAGNLVRLATRDQQARLYEAGGMLHTETLPVPNTSLLTLDKVRLDNYIRDILKDPEVPTTESEWIDRLFGIGLMTRDALDKPVCTIAGVVLFGMRPRFFVRQAGLRVMAFQGLEKEYEARLDVVLDGPMVGRWEITKNDRRLIDAGLIEKFVESIKPFVSREAAEVDESFRREKSWFYPLEAVRETVINALAHRDWTRSTDIEVSGYADRLEVVSPGSLTNSMTVQKMRAGQRSTRNQIIVEVLRDYGYVDSRGMGVRTKVIPLMEAAGSTPLFEATDDFLRTTLIRPTSMAVKREIPLRYKGSDPDITGPSVHDNRSEYVVTPRLTGQKSPSGDLIVALVADPGANYASLAALLGVSEATIKRRLQRLKQAGQIRRVGSKKTGTWDIIEL